MSLRPDDRSKRSRSKSPGRERSRSRSHVRDAADAGTGGHNYEIRQPSQQYATPTTDPVTMGSWSDYPPEQRPGYQAPGVAYSQPGNVQYSTQQFAYSATPASSTTSHAGPTRAPSSSGNGGYQYAQTPANLTYSAKPVVPSAQQQPQGPAYPPQAHPQYAATSQAQHPQHPQQYPNAQPSYPPPPPMGAQSPHPQQYSTAQPSYPPPPPMGAHSPHPSDNQRGTQHQRTTSTPDGRRVVEMVPSGGGRLNTPPSPGGMRPHSLSVNGGRPDGLANRMDRLSVSGNRPDIQTIVPGGMMGGGMPPPSPLLEAYHGTYQSISPMPGAMMMDDDLDHLSSLDSLSPRASSQSMHGGRHRAHSRSRRTPSPPHHSRPKDKLALEAYGRPERSPDNRDSRDYRDGRDGRDSRDSRDSRDKEKRRVRIYDATDDALALVDAMANKTPNTDPIIDILPALSHDQMLELRNEYKRYCKVQGRGINIAKHIKLKTSGNFGKIAYVTALGKYEGEGYWANYWYQSNSARRELLIEALMGRQNHEIREIKDAFKDKRYADSLVRCMDKELKADKFRKAVLMALEAERQEESDVWPMEYRNRDVETLYKAMKAREGGESAMLGVVIMRSDAHLREVLRGYERRWGSSFARDALRKSNNLVGEVIAHILNGVINRPARDAMLLHHALMDLIEPPAPSAKATASSSASTKHERQQRFELLISRLVRLHWERAHFARVKAEYEEKYGRVVEEDLEEATKGDFREFCIALCQMGR